ncbi:MAG: hypothetical protein IK020_08810 [Clostridiales bacterium]|nr:hypothetical protein [Clostridiales bacterium]
MECIVTFDAGSEVEIPQQNLSYNSTATNPDVPHTGRYKIKGWTYNGAPYDFKSLVRDNITLVAVWSYVASAQSATVIFEGGLKLRFTLQFSEELLEDQEATITFKKAGQTVETYNISSVVNSEGEAQFEFPVQAMEWQDVFTAEVFDANGDKVVFRNAQGQEYDDDTMVYSVYQHYLNGVNGGFEDTDYCEFLEYGLGYYCGNAQIYFGYNVESMQGNYECPDFTTESEYKMTATSPRPSWVTGTSLRVKFTDNNTLRVTFTLTEDSIANYSFSLKDCEGNVVTTEAKRISANRYALDAENIAAPNLTKNFTFTITNTTANESYTITASAMSYAILAMEKGSTEKMIQLGKALYFYGEAAKTYFNIHGSQEA